MNCSTHFIPYCLKKQQWEKNETTTSRAIDDMIKPSSRMKERVICMRLLRMKIKHTLYTSLCRCTEFFPSNSVETHKIWMWSPFGSSPFAVTIIFVGFKASEIFCVHLPTTVDGDADVGVVDWNNLNWVVVAVGPWSLSCCIAVERAKRNAWPCITSCTMTNNRDRTLNCILLSFSLRWQQQTTRQNQKKNKALFKSYLKIPVCCSVSVCALVFWKVVVRL